MSGQCLLMYNSHLLVEVLVLLLSISRYLLLHSLLPRLHNRLLNRPPQLLHSSLTPSHKKQAPTTCHSKGVYKFVYKQEVQRKMNLCTSVF